jgi:hypothetical protein
MSHGFAIYSSTDELWLSSLDFTVALIDVFEVTPSSSGSRTYAGAADLDFFVGQSSVEPVNVTAAVLSSFSSMAISVSVSGQAKVVSWSPGAQTGTLQNVIIYVFGA